MDSLYHKSNKNAQELLDSISEESETEVTKIVPVLGPGWVACSLKSAILSSTF
jgi:hypothetical protein